MSQSGLVLAAPVATHYTRVTEGSVRDGVVGAAGAGVGGFVTAQLFQLFEYAQGYRPSYLKKCLPEAGKMAGVAAVAGLFGGLVNGLTEDLLGDSGRFVLSVGVGCLASALVFGRGSSNFVSFLFWGALGGALSFGANGLFS